MDSHPRCKIRVLHLRVYGGAGLQGTPRDSYREGLQGTPRDSFCEGLQGTPRDSYHEGLQGTPRDSYCERLQGIPRDSHLFMWCAGLQGTPSRDSKVIGPCSICCFLLNLGRQRE